MVVVVGDVVGVVVEDIVSNTSVDEAPVWDSFGRSGPRSAKVPSLRWGPSRCRWCEGSAVADQGLFSGRRSTAG